VSVKLNAPWEKAPCTHWIGGWVDPRTGLDNMEKRKIYPLPGLELRPLSCPAHSQLPYRTHYPGFHEQHITPPFYSAQCTCRGQHALVARMHLSSSECGKPLLTCLFFLDATLAFPSRKLYTKCISAYSALVKHSIYYHCSAPGSNARHTSLQYELRLCNVMKAPS
jgi:hypothetical protein